MTQTIFLHLGLPKTGTSTLQATLYKLSDDLLQRGINYPSPNVEGYSWKAARGMSAGNTNLQIDISGDEENISSVLKTLRVNLTSLIEDGSDCKKTVLSSEVLSIFTLKNQFWTTLATMESNSRLKFKVIVYVRNPFSYFLSCYGQAVKEHGFTGNLDEFVHSFVAGSSVLSFSVYRNIKNIIKFAEQSNIELVFFHHKATKDGIVPHFFKNVLELDLSDFTYKATDSFNEGLTPLVLEFHRGINCESPHLGRLLGFERTDPVLNFQTKTIKEIGIQHQLSESSRHLLLSAFEVFKDESKDLLSFHSDMSFEIDDTKVCFEQSAHDKLISQQIFELGKFVALSYKHGYIHWDKN